jgi:hypothetical protein
MMKELVDKVGKDKVAAVVTDNPSSMRLARQLLTSMDGYKHILGFRCYMHLFALIMNSVISHAYARDLIAKAQKIVTYFRASHRPLSLLRDAAAAVGIKGTLKTSNQTRLTSVAICLESVLAMQDAFSRLLREHPDILESQQEVEELVSDRQYFTDLKALCKVLAPFSKVIMAVQRQHSTIADLGRYLLYLGKELEAALVAMPAGELQRHCRRLMDTGLQLCIVRPAMLACRLACEACHAARH